MEIGLCIMFILHCGYHAWFLEFGGHLLLGMAEGNTAT